MKVKMYGRVKWYNKEKGYGYIIGGDDESYYFELLNCLNKDEEFNSGDLVKFIPHFENIEYATEVEKAGDNSEKIDTNTI